MWDYSISTDDMEDLLAGKIDKAGHYSRENLFAKMLKGLPWYTLLQLLSPVNVKKLLTEEVIESLWPESVKTQYKYVKKRLQETLPDSG